MRTLSPKLRTRVVLYGSAVLAIAGIVYPWFSASGYIFLLDYVATPVIRLSSVAEVYSLSGWLPKQVLGFLSYVFPAELVQKAYIAALLVSAWWGMSAFSHWLLRRHGMFVGVASILSGLFYAINPFVIQRLFMGQHLLLLAYALTPFAILAWLRFFATPSYKHAIVGAMLVGAVYMANIHHVVLLTALLIVITPYYRIRAVQARFTGVLVALLCVFIGGLLMHRTLVSTSALSLDPQGAQVFQLRAPISGNLLVDTILLSATWNTTLPLLSPFEILPVYLWAYIALLGSAIAGVYVLRIKDSHFMWQLLLAAMAAMFFALGVAHPISAGVARWLYAHIPFWIGMRDTGKFLAVLALVQSIFMGYGIAYIFQRVRGRTKNLGIAYLIVCSILGFTFLIPSLRGFSGQILPAPYPDAWYAWNEEMAQLDEKPTMIFLPWHQYSIFSFTDGRSVVSPAPGFFSAANVIAAQTVEASGPGGMPYLYAESKAEPFVSIDTILQSDGKSDVVRGLREFNVLYVALAIDVPDAPTYEWLFHDPHLEIVFHEGDLVVFKNSYISGL